MKKAILLRTLFFSVIPLLLHGCGGSSAAGDSSGSSSSSTSNLPTAADVDITSSNSTKVAATTADATTNSGTTTSPLGVAVSAEANAGPSLFDVAEQAVSLAQDGAPSIPVGTTVTNRLVNCKISGNMTVSGQVTDTNDISKTAGDYISIVANNCYNSSNAKFNGSFSLKVVNSSSTFRTLKFEYKNLSFTSGSDQLSFPSITSNFTFEGGNVGSSFVAAKLIAVTTGAYTLTANGVSRTRTANNLREILRDGRYALDGTTQSQGYGKTYSINGLMTNSRLNGTLKYSTVSDLTFDSNASYPKSGQIIVEGKKGKLRLTAQSDAVHVFVELDADGDGVYETNNTLSWSQLLADI